MRGSAASWNISASVALLTPAWPRVQQPSYNHIDWLLKEDWNCSGCSYLRTEHWVPKEIHTGCAKQAVATALYPEQRLIPLDCTHSFGSVIPLSAVQSKKTFSLPRAQEDVCIFYLALFAIIHLGNSAPV